MKKMKKWIKYKIHAIVPNEVSRSVGSLADNFFKSGGRSARAAHASVPVGSMERFGLTGGLAPSALALSAAFLEIVGT